MTRKEDLPALVAHLHSIGVNALFQLRLADGSPTMRRSRSRDIDQGGLGLPDRDYYLKTDARSLELKQKYQDHVQKMLAMLGDAAGEGRPATRAPSWRSRPALAEAALDRTARRDPAATDHMMSTAEWQALTPDDRLVEVSSRRGRPGLRSAQRRRFRSYLKALNALVASTPLDDLKAYLTWQLVNASADMLPKAFADADFDFFSRTLGGQQEPLPRWQRCVTQTDSRARRGARQGVRRRGLRAGREGRHARDGRGHQGGDEARTSTRRRG